MLKYQVCKGVWESLLKPEKMILAGEDKHGRPNWDMNCAVCGKQVRLSNVGRLMNHKAV